MAWSFEWRTLEALAAHKRGYRSPSSSKREYKVELWLLFPTQGIVRTLALDAGKVRPDDEARATSLLGTEAWRAIYDLRAEDKLSARDAKEEYVNLMRWRLSEELGYQRTHALELKNTRGGTLYHMVFATDNNAGDKIMADIYAKTASQMPQMRKKRATASSAKPRWTSAPPTRQRMRRTTTNLRGSLPRCPD